MMKNYNKDKKPFKVGQLVRLHVGDPYIGLYLVLKIQWDTYNGEWWVHVFCQRSGLLHWRPAMRFEAIEENDD